MSNAVTHVPMNDGSTLWLNSEHAAWFGAMSVHDALAVEGDIVSGHPDRHVMRARFVETDVILKREHRVPWRDRFANWRAGFGFVSVSVREALALSELKTHGVPVPDWIAAGETAEGRAFLMLKPLSKTIDLRQALTRKTGPVIRRRLAFLQTLAGHVAALHRAGFDYPDLYAKHILVNPRNENVAFIDWQRARRVPRLTWSQRVRNLAALHASLAGHLATPKERMVFLRWYARLANVPATQLGRLAQDIQTRSARLLRRSSTREQRAGFAESQTLRWLDGEALCVTPLGEGSFRSDELSAFAAADSAVAGVRVSSLTLADGKRAKLTVRITRRPFGAFMDKLRQRRWTSPELMQAAQCLRRERHGHEAALLAFGQRFGKWGRVRSFVLVRE